MKVMWSTGQSESSAQRPVFNFIFFWLRQFEVKVKICAKKECPMLQVSPDRGGFTCMERIRMPGDFPSAWWPQILVRIRPMRSPSETPLGKSACTHLAFCFRLAPLPSVSFCFSGDCTPWLDQARMFFVCAFGRAV